MVKIKISELEGVALDWAVAKIEFPQNVAISSSGDRVMVTNHGVEYAPYAPSTNWAQGGPLIEKHKIRLAITAKGEWYATTDGYIYGADMSGLSPSLLVAAMRAIVASKIGDTVDVPKELL